MASSMRPAARLCWMLEARSGAFLFLDLVGAGLFVLGCVAFYFPVHYVTGVTLFLLGSISMLASTAGRVFARYGPSR